MLFLILASGFALRLLSLNSHAFWFDEALTYHFAKLDLKNLLQVIASDNNPPLYYILIHFLLKISSNEIFLRLPSFIASILTVAVLWRLSPVAASLFSISPLAVYIGTEARLHSLAMLFATLAYFFFLKVLKKSAPKNIISFIILSILALYTQYYLILLFIPFLIITYFKRKKSLWVPLAPLLILAPWLIFSINFGHNGCWCPNTVISLPATLVSPMINGVGIVTQRNFVDLPIPTLLLFSITALIFLIVFAKGIFRNLSLSIVYFVPILILSFLGIFWPLFSPKGASILSPFFFLIVAQGLKKARRPSLLLITLVVLLTAVSLLQIISPFFRGENLKTISQIIKTKNQPVIHTSLTTFYSQNYYLLPFRHSLITPNPLNQKMVNSIGGEQSDIDSFEHIWLIDYAKWVNPDIYQTKKDQVFSLYQIQTEYKVDSINLLDLKRKE